MPTVDAVLAIAEHLGSLDSEKEITPVLMRALERWSIDVEGGSEVRLRVALFALQDAIQQRIQSL